VADQRRQAANQAKARAVYVEPVPMPSPVIPTPDERLGQAHLLRYMLVQVRNRARADYGELTGRHTDLLEFERAIDLLIEPLDSLIEILGRAAVDAN